MSERDVTSACPCCGATATRQTYDIGSGPELSCASCEWCWGADGQPLKPLDVSELVARAQAAQAAVNEIIDRAERESR